MKPCFGLQFQSHEPKIMLQSCAGDGHILGKQILSKDSRLVVCVGDYELDEVERVKLSSWGLLRFSHIAAPLLQLKIPLAEIGWLCAFESLFTLLWLFR